MDNKNTCLLDYVKWFLDNNLDSPRNTFIGNMKLQKLLFFAQLISLAKNNKLLFDDNFSLCNNSVTLDIIRLEYKNNLDVLLNYKPNIISKEDLEVLELKKNIYGQEDADTLSDMSQHFSYIKCPISSNEISKFNNIIYLSNEELKSDLDNIRDVLYAYEIINSNAISSN